MNKIQLTFPANLHYSSVVRHVTDEICEMAKFSKTWRGRLKLVVDELFMNAVKYGSTEDKSTVYILYSYDENGFEFTIEDDGSGPKAISVDELKAIIKQNKSDESVEKTSGRGLSMITHLWTDDVNISKSKHGGIAITFSKAIDATDPKPIGGSIANATGEPIGASKHVGGGSVYTIKLDAGEIDQTNVSKKTQPVYEQIKVMPQNGVLVLDFGDVTYINSMFIAHLASWHASMHQRGGQVHLKNLKNQVQEILDLVGLSKVLLIDK